MTSPRRISGVGVFVLAAALGVLSLLGGPAAATAAYFRTAGEYVAVGINMQPANDESLECAISGNGRYAVFSSLGTNLVPSDTNGQADIFVRDRAAGRTVRVSVGTSGTQANGMSYNPSISSDGRFVAFSSDASNLVPNDTNDVADVFVRDTFLGVTERVSVGMGGAQGCRDSERPSISGDGRFVAFESCQSRIGSTSFGAVSSIFVRDRLLGTTVLESFGIAGAGNDDSFSPSLSYDGRFLAFESFAGNLVAGDGNAACDVFVRDRLSYTTTMASSPMSGGSADGDSLEADISSDGRFVAFASEATNLVPGDTNPGTDIFVRDQMTGVLTNATRGLAAGRLSASTPSISDDGSVVAFGAKSLADFGLGSRKCYCATVSNGAVELLSTRTARYPVISADGRYVSIVSDTNQMYRTSPEGLAMGWVITRGPVRPRVVRAPSSGSKTVKRKRGVAAYSLSAVVTDQYGMRIPGARVQLQRYEPKKKRWRSYKAPFADRNGSAVIQFRSRKPGKTVFRWYVPAADGRAAGSTGRQTIRVK